MTGSDLEHLRVVAERMERRTGVRILVDERRAPAAAALRELSSAILDTACADQLAEVTAELRHTRARLPDPSPPSRFSGAAYPLDTHPVVGPGNTLAPPLRLHTSAAGVEARVAYGALEESFPGEVFGGLISAAFDAVMGFAAAECGGVVKARTITVDFIAPTPTHRPLRYTAVADTTGHESVATTATLVLEDTGQLLAQASAEFARVSM